MINHRKMFTPPRLHFTVNEQLCVAYGPYIDRTTPSWMLYANILRYLEDETYRVVIPLEQEFRA